MEYIISCFSFFLLLASECGRSDERDAQAHIVPVCSDPLLHIFRNESRRVIIDLFITLVQC